MKIDKQTTWRGSILISLGFKLAPIKMQISEHTTKAKQNVKIA
jgi:hypothetical protein